MVHYRSESVRGSSGVTEPYVFKVDVRAAYGNLATRKSKRESNTGNVKSARLDVSVEKEPIKLWPMRIGHVA